MLFLKFPNQHSYSYRCLQNFPFNSISILLSHGTLEELHITHPALNNWTYERHPPQCHHYDKLTLFIINYSCQPHISCQGSQFMQVIHIAMNFWRPLHMTNIITRQIFQLQGNIFTTTTYLVIFWICIFAFPLRLFRIRKCSFQMFFSRIFKQL